MPHAQGTPDRITHSENGSGGSTDVSALNKEVTQLIVETNTRDWTTFEAQHVTLVASTDTTITFSAAVRAVQVKNWDTSFRVLVKDGAIATDVDATASRVGKAPAADVNNSDWFPFATTTIHLRSANTSEVTIEGYR